jgi:aminoglycoside phosphotransferase (APT) family kinase protein
MTAGTPPPDFPIDVDLVRALLRAQHPDLADLPIAELAHGWDNAIFRLGDALLVRLPRRQVAAALLQNEQRWLPVLARRLPLPIPVHSRMGAPTDTYPWSWSIVPWLQGETADTDPLGTDQARPLAEFLRALHAPPPPDAPRNPVRGVSLRAREAAVEERFKRVERVSRLITRRLRSMWQASLAAPIDVADTWIHGDLHARNVLVQQGRLAAVIDWGDLAGGDCATDLAAVWMLLSTREARLQAMRTLDHVSDATWRRARGWAILFGVTLLDTGLVDNPRHARMGEQILLRLREGP